MKIIGVSKIFKFNLHFYLGSFILIFLILPLLSSLQGIAKYACIAIVGIMLFFIISSLVISWYIYDYKDIQSLEFLRNRTFRPKGTALNIHAGYDESSEVLKNLFPDLNWTVMDFFDAGKHTERSLQVARKSTGEGINSERIKTSSIPKPNNSIDTIFLIFSAHEIRTEKERLVFFKELKRVLSHGGKIIIVEHLCDLPNFIAYGPGALHFWSEKTWRRSFMNADLKVEGKIKLNFWINSFILTKK